MSEIIYILTVIYFAYVVDDVEGDKLVAFIKDFLNIDFSYLHGVYRNFRDSILTSISHKTAIFA